MEFELLFKMKKKSLSNCMKLKEDYINYLEKKC